MKNRFSIKINTKAIDLMQFEYYYITKLSKNYQPYGYTNYPLLTERYYDGNESLKKLSSNLNILLKSEYDLDLGKPIIHNVIYYYSSKAD